MDHFRDKIAVITGASSGIGKAIALSLSEEGSRLCLIGRNTKNLKGIIESTKVAAPDTKSCNVDLTSDAEIDILKTDIQKEFGVIDILVHSAGIFSMGLLEETTAESLDLQYKINMRAPYLLTQALLPMIKARQGQIVFINSSVGLRARATLAQYAATKHALKAIADSLRDEVNGEGVRVLSIYLGRTATPMQFLMHTIEGKAYHPERLIQPEDVAAVVLNALALPRTAEVTDINIRPMLKPS